MIEEEVYAEAEKWVLEDRVREVTKKLIAADNKLIAADNKLMEAEMYKRLLEKEAQSYKDDLMVTQHKMEIEQDLLERTTYKMEALEGELADTRRAKEKMGDLVRGLNRELEKK